MLQRFSVNFIILSMFLDASLTALSLKIAVALRPYLPSFLPLLQPLAAYEVEVPIVLYVVFPLIWSGIFLLTGVYEPRHIYDTDEFQRLSLSMGVAALSSAGLLYLTFRDVSRWLFISFLILDIVSLSGWRLIGRAVWRFGGRAPIRRRVLIAGAGEVGRRVAQVIAQYDWSGFEFVGYVDDQSEENDTGLRILGTLDNSLDVVEAYDIDDVVIALPLRAHIRLNRLVAVLHDTVVHVWVVPDYFSLALYRASVDSFAGIPMVDLRAPALNDAQRLLKRLCDLVIGPLLLLLLSPVMALIAAAIKMDSPGPVFFLQTRIGENGRPFTMYKFRSMVHGAESLQEHVNTVDDKGHVIHKRRVDPRVTRVGRVLRRFSLDELPQLFNVLKGEMSLVGPRPEMPWLVDKYESWQRKRFAVPPGVTGWWQINGRADRPMHLHTEDDLYYIQNYSLLFDLTILWKTLWVVLRGKGAY